MDIIAKAKQRHTAKTYSNKKISAIEIEQIKDLLRLSPSSTNLQPWHFILASSDEAKQKIAKSVEEKYFFNKQAILSSSHIVIFCVKEDISEEYLFKVLEQEEQDGRFLNNPDFKTQMHTGRSMFVELHKSTFKDLSDWLAKQVYINLGMFLLGVEGLGINATAMEGFDAQVIDKEFELSKKGYHSLLVVPIGYSSNEDYNAKLPKSRFPASEIITEQ